MSGHALKGTAEQAVQDPNFWRSFRDEFQLLADEQRKNVRAMRQGDRRLRAYCGYNSDTDRTPLETELVAKGLACLLYRLESGTWQLGEGPSEDLKARFEALGTRAGIALKPPHGVTALDFWLHSLSLHLRRTASQQFFGCSDIGGYVEDICQASATLCSFLEKKACDGWPMPGPHHNKPENERESFVKPILDKKGWSIHNWATEAEVDFHTASGYLKGTRKPYRSTRKKLAAPLGVEVEDLPK